MTERGIESVNVREKEKENGRESANESVRERGNVSGNEKESVNVSGNVRESEKGSVSARLETGIGNGRESENEWNLAGPSVLARRRTRPRRRRNRRERPGRKRLSTRLALTQVVKMLFYLACSSCITPLVILQERLRSWETRERRKLKDLDKEREKERLKEEEREKEAKKLKEFLEDYDDERDDAKYYKYDCYVHES